ncbi:hypothetical protein [Flavobacterium subsaxonicum]|uniref:CHAT domain-containing protein n=1 Tax=Flavobacterium subsaxonicum WB 4.1-42 = DSM 21790 TaxID=1121898 RepID=A0A0A2MP31_9FLAO|nr:hypothetical protein [Flavobacterium subsaxonicum]KGO93183.1 hypothetical protein Q766_07690 [Flavobacterium subsaxonicum WB 4.1-42 = DSM 21790]
MTDNLIFNKKFFCIIDRDNIDLGAVISSYVCKRQEFTPIFEFSNVTDADHQNSEQDIDEHSFSRNRSRQFNIQIKNALQRTGEIQYLILGGLSDEQKSYLNFVNNYNVLEINSCYEAMAILGPITEKYNTLSCPPHAVLTGLHVALNKGMALKIEENSLTPTYENAFDSGLIVIENIQKTSCVIAVNYAFNISADVMIISEPSLNIREIKDLIERWRKGDGNAYNDLSVALYKSFEDVDFTNYRYSTFFTVGAPYALILKNLILFTHVHLRLKCDFFIFNCIHFETKEMTNSAIVFSPLEFKDEETEYIINILQQRNYYVKELIGKQASVYQINNHVKEFPFDLLHICSHGGEISGYSVSKQFTDRDGNQHSVEFDEVVSFAPSHNEELIPVTVKVLPRRFNDLVWGSEAMKANNYPHHVFVDMYQAINDVQKSERIKKAIVPNSCAIKCVDFYYQAVFDSIALMRSPFVFNNTCWSWIDIADSFLAGGSRAYIGTLWQIDNAIAKEVAEQFYERVFDDTILSALYKSIECTKATNNQDIYIIWGLHFSTLTTNPVIENPKLNVARRLLNSLSDWKIKQREASIDSKNAIQSLILWTATELAHNYLDETKMLIKNSPY